jgi:hypothetical protein
LSKKSWPSYFEVKEIDVGQEAPLEQPFLPFEGTQLYIQIVAS